jgi:ATP phosphoribosyltransferase regulatory subunit
METDRDLLPEGLEDRLPRDAAAAARVTRAVLDVLDSHGYDRVQPPSIEFEKSLASRMAGVQPRRMFRFVDPASLRTLALRSDLTPQVGRIAATALAARARPLRLCYAGQVVTIKGDGLDPTRERLQLGAELIGSDNVAAAGEIVAAAIEALSAAGATGLSVDFTLPDLVRSIVFMLAEGDISKREATTQAEALERALDDKDAGEVAKLGWDFMPLIDAVGPIAKALPKLRTFIASYRLEERLGHRLDALQAIVSRLPDGVRVTLDPTERHGFEYQSWFGFTIYADGVSGALGRGGSYRILGLDEPAIGFSLYPDRLIDALADREPERDALFLPLGHDRDHAVRLRAVGWRTVAALSDQDDGKALGCTHRLESGEAVRL